MTKEIFSKEVPELLTTHFEHLRASAISVEVIRERGYTTVMGHKPLKDVGFSKAQQRYPGILIPMYGPDGSIAGYQYKPDKPRVSGEKKLKYENPLGAHVRLDVPPRCRQYLGDPRVDLWFTEGIKKVDALATAGVCAIGLTGVWGFKGRNIFGGTTVLADFDYITFKDRKVFTVFDSDLASNSRVRQALDRLTEHLSRKGADVRLIFLPGGPNDEKVGADDFLAAGHTIDELKSHVSKVAPKQEPTRIRFTSSYDIIDGAIHWIKPESKNTIEEVPLCNFDARITQDITRDDGQELKSFFKIEGSLTGKRPLPDIEVTSPEFAGLSWVTSKWGSRAIIAAGQNAKDRLREAIQAHSQAQQRTIYTHTGWREIDGDICFLHGAGALGRDDIEVELETALKRYQLLPPAGDPTEAIRNSLNFYLVAPPDCSIPLLVSMYLAPLTEFIDTAFTIWLAGPSGSYKSTITSLALCHFGDFDSRHMPAEWRDSQYTLEKLMFALKDLPLLVDDWAPGKTSSKAQDLETKAEYIVRAQGNRQGRQRMKADTSIRQGYAPRGLLITSGEHLPGGHSETARIFTLEIDEEGDVDINWVTTAQSHQVTYCQAMSNYISWLQQRYQELKTGLRRRWSEHRDSVREECNNLGKTHPRMPEAIASFICAAELMTEYAMEYEAMDKKESETFRNESRAIFVRLAAQQAVRVESERPARRAMELLRTMINQGTAFLVNRDNTQPGPPAPGTKNIGWYFGNNGTMEYYLNPSAAYQAIVEYAQRSGDPFTIKKEALWKDMRRMSYTICDDGRTTKLIRIFGKPTRVIQVKHF